MTDTEATPIPVLPHPDHRCQAVECMETVPGHRLMCVKHWKLVPESIQHALFRLWNPAKTHDMQPESVQCWINEAVKQVGIIERKVIS